MVIGSGATAVTLVPAMAETAAHVTMLQRSPSYIVALPAEDPVASVLRRLPARLAYAVLRWKNVLLMLLSFQLSRRRPELVKKLIRKGVERRLPAGYPIDTHFKPPYNPWDQRMCLVPDSDLFEAISAGRASVVTDRIATLTEDGIELGSGDRLRGRPDRHRDRAELASPRRHDARRRRREHRPPRADGLQGHDARRRAQLRDGARLHECLVDAQVRPHLRVRLPAAQPHGRARLPPVHAGERSLSGPGADHRLQPGYILRSIEKFPKQGSRRPWRLYQNYALDIFTLRYGNVDDGALFSPSPSAPHTRVTSATSAATSSRAG